MAQRPTVPLLVAVLLAGCGGSDGDGASTDRSPAADLTVTVRPDGPGTKARRRAIECDVVGKRATSDTCRRLGGLAAATLRPVSHRTACTQIFGGPAVATARGTLRGERVRASFSLQNGCEIERWRDAEALLGPPPGNAPHPGVQ